MRYLIRIKMNSLIKNNNNRINQINIYKIKKQTKLKKIWIINNNNNFVLNKKYIKIIIIIVW